MKDDIAESTNLTDAYPKKSNELLSKLKEWQSRVGAEMPTVNEEFIKTENKEL